ncbi:RNA dependent RNA polymerase-domain-containing protein [Massariosphaeria phaeospora]|uniref:RNA-dependent RNA polymerase n=1 Tax=Massariosphaeria phaeospora TaxID=100035 RepID=A0A7C8I463_9PLEO|nr:RNA dependent RNA polymerase-domain-containing protein [Massariosphaeria phaeospora]
MDVFMHNLPTHLTSQALQTQLASSMTSLNIVDWSCHKPRNKRFGNITFLHVWDGQDFLRRFDPQSSLAAIQLVIFGANISCKRSNKAADPFSLKSLHKAAVDRSSATVPSRTNLDTRVNFVARSLSCGYYDYADGELAYSPDVEWDTLGGGQVKFAKQMLIVEFVGQGGTKRVEVPYRIVEDVVVSTRPPSLTLTLWEAPRFFHVEQEKSDIGSLMAALSMQQKSPTHKTRLIELPGGSSSHHRILGQALVYQIPVSPYLFDETTRKLLDRDMLTIYHHNLVATPLHLRRTLQKGLTDFRETMQLCSSMVPFSVLYQLEALVINGYLLPWTVQALLGKMWKHNTELIASKTTKDFPISSGAVKALFPQLPFPSPEVDASTFEVDELWAYILANEKSIHNGLTKELISERGRQNLTMVHKVHVTPTGITLHGPEPEAKNRILRRFPDHSDYFIRVQFCDEDGTDLHFNSNVSLQDIYQRFEQVFKSGIPIGGRVFGFLGFSHSSLRGHSAWFMASFVHEGKLQTYFSVIAHLGRFDNIYSPARCAARIGQAFSETPQAISLSKHGITNRVIQDVTSADGSRVFSDGVGTISQAAMEAIHTAFPLQRNLPTCFQIRWGGAKGMLALDPRLEGNVLCFRPSMIKFNSSDNENLEICDTANRPIPMVLNRQMIKILEDMGVSEHWFSQQQARALKKLQLVTAHIANTVAFLKRQNVADKIGFPQLIKRLDELGLDYRRDRFLSSVVEAAVLRELRLLKHKARILIERGVTLFGIMDETGYLNEGEVYVAFDDVVFVRDHSEDLDNRRMIITRSPALHPGDIQLADNVIPPDHHPLRSLKNCIVFSQHGKRDLPSSLSGGDLDGDTYGIIWDPQAVRECQHVFEPADYPRVEPLSINRVVQREDMTDFFIQFMATDQLGLIAVRHMILADQKDTGTVDQDCKLLAEMHSTGVDYSKTGIPVDMTKFFKIRMNKYRPDFLAPAAPAHIKNRTEISFSESDDPGANPDADDADDVGPKYQYYYSEKINGKLYRAINEKKIWHENVKLPTGPAVDIWQHFVRSANFECDQRLGRRSSRLAAEKEAWEIRSAYEDAMHNTTLDYSSHATARLTELEVFTGAIFTASGIQTRRQRDQSLRLKDEFDRIAAWAEAMMRKKQQPQATTAKPASASARDDGENDDDEAARAKRLETLVLSIACLNVGCRAKTGGPLKSRGGGMGRVDDEVWSFRVVAACCVIRELDDAVDRKAL